MRKNILIIAAAFALSLPVAAAPMQMQMEMGVAEQIDAERSIEITADRNVVRVTGAAGMTIEVVSLTGRHITTIKIDQPTQNVELNLPKGCYILKVGKVVRKVTLR